MNIRNLSFIVVLFLVWLMGYYYYSPQETFTLNNQELSREIPEETQPLHGEVNDILPTLQTEENLLTTTLEASPNEYTFLPSQEELPKELIPPLTPKKKRTKKEKKQDKIPYIRKDKKIEIPLFPTTKINTIPPHEISDNDAVNNTISITSSLKKRDIGYYKMLSWHHPYLFNLTVNDQPLFTKKDKTITAAQSVTINKNEPFIIRYSYEWHTPWGKRIGAKKVTFKAKPAHKVVKIRALRKLKEMVA